MPDVIKAPFDVTDKVVLVTGAGRGIARGIAEVFAANGADVALNALTPRYLEPAVEAIAATSGRRAVAYPADMTSPESVDATIAAVLAEFGRIDVLVNGVGDAIAGPLASLSHDDLERNLDLNLRATLLGSRAVGGHFLERGSGSVINISSVSTVRAHSDASIYAAGKAGIEGFTRALAIEWAPFNVTVNCIAPGYYPDPYAGIELDPEILESLRTTVPLGQLGNVHDVGYLAVFLASPAASYLTGQTIHLDGGVSC